MQLWKSTPARSSRGQLSSGDVLSDEGLEREEVHSCADWHQTTLSWTASLYAVEAAPQLTPIRNQVHQSLSHMSAQASGPSVGWPWASIRVQTVVKSCSSTRSNLKPNYYSSYEACRSFNQSRVDVVLVCLGSKLVQSKKHSGQRGHHPSKLRPEEGRSQVRREAQSNAVSTTRKPGPRVFARAWIQRQRSSHAAWGSSHSSSILPSENVPSSCFPQQKKENVVLNLN